MKAWPFQTLCYKINWQLIPQVHTDIWVEDKGGRLSQTLNQSDLRELGLQV